MRITFVGTGYVGLVSGVMMSHVGHDVICLDLDKDKIQMLKGKKTPIFEPGLDEYIDKYANTECLSFVHGYDSLIKDSECVFITVGTPPKNDGDADLSGIFAAVAEVCKHVDPHCVIVIKSTVPPGTCSAIQAFIINNGFSNVVVSNPEFLREGCAINDFLHPDRIVIGTSSLEALDTMQAVYAPMINEGIAIVETDLTTSELIKYASNTFLANKIAFINEMADLCEVVGADIKTLARGVGLDKRIGESFLKAGPGFGGSCFPKDILALQKLSQKVDSDFLVLDAVIQANSNRPNAMIKKIIAAIGGTITGKKLAILGLTYKAGTDDLRSSPAVDLIHKLQEFDVRVVAYDPEGMVNVPKYLKKLECAHSMMEAIKQADAIIIATEWEEFKAMDLIKVKALLKFPIIIDLRNILDANELERNGFKYYSVGRKSGN